MPVPMPPTDALFLAAETPKRPMHVGALALLSGPEGGHPHHVREMFAAALARERVAPLWRRRPRRSLTSLGQWYWHTDTTADLSYHVRLSALPRNAGMAGLWDLVAELHSEMLDRSRPLWQLHLIEGLGDQRYGLYVKTHHAMADGVSAMGLLQRTVSADPDRRGMPAMWEIAGHARSSDTTATAGRAGGLSAARRVMETAEEWAGMVPAMADTAWRALRGRGGPLSLAAPHTPLNVSMSNSRVVAGCTFPIERLRLVAKHADATLNDVVLAMCSGALRRYLLAREALPAAPLVAMVPVSLREAENSGAPGDVPGNKIGTLMCSLGTHLADPAERLAAVQASMRDGKAALARRSPLQVLAMSAVGAVPLALAMVLGRAPGVPPPPNVMISNVPGPVGPLYWNGARLEALYPVSVPVDGQTLNITCTSLDGQMSFGLTGCRRAVPQIGTLADLLGRELDVLDAFHRLPEARRERHHDRRPRRRPSSPRSGQAPAMRSSSRSGPQRPLGPR
ncbi:MAG: wax ester/triacylglycerol synthase family O-acyltransferase [Mycobacterium sp.]|uniref:WS/DGAT/MGAT family O-acyltransferase n=1 Tax=Mycobacterium sp. TaxID=1785 RepID=UPI0026162659|nr:wax ester/triacylglycerol synthase family O-acyltransferase [Mycobacterium sp.]MDI3314818.1 wax ester/triacylglycerol synthase family O-acyltransferase [Mycobacterium sp.]